MRLASQLGWILDLPEVFELIKNEDSLQATDGVRTIYFSALALSQPGTKKPVPANELHDRARPKSGKVFELSDGPCLGYAQLVSENPRTFHLKSTREAAGTILTCVITYTDPADLDWALSVWKSVRAP